MISERCQPRQGPRWVNPPAGFLANVLVRRLACVAGIEAALGCWTTPGRTCRAGRQPRELESFIDLCQRLGLTNVASVSGDIDLTTAEGQFQARILGAVAKKESDDKSRRIRRKHLEIAAEGRVSGGGSRPYGYEADKVTIRPAEAAVVTECAQRLLAGEPVRSIAQRLNEQGVPTSTGGEWSPQSLRRILASPRISGQRAHHGEIVADAEWPAIISAEDGAKIR